MPSGNVINHTLTTNPINGVQSWVPNDLYGPKWERDGKDRSGMIKASVALAARRTKKQPPKRPDLDDSTLSLDKHGRLNTPVPNYLKLMGTIMAWGVILFWISIILKTCVS